MWEFFKNLFKRKKPEKFPPWKGPPGVRRVVKIVKISKPTFPPITEDDIEREMDEYE